MSEYLKIRDQIAKLQKEAEILRERERAQIIANVKDAIVAFQITAEDLGLAGATHPRRVPKAVAGTKLDHLSKKLPMENNQRRSGVGNKSLVTDRRSIVAPKYRDLATGTTWTGRGKQPKWLATAIKNGKKLEEFKI